MKTSYMTLLTVALLLSIFSHPGYPASSRADSSKSDTAIFGFRDAAAERTLESRFLAVPDPKRAEEHLRTLTKAPHIAGSPEDKATADYVAQKFRDAGLSTEILEYKVWFNYPSEISVDITAPAGVSMHGPTREHVDGDPFQDDPRVVLERVAIHVLSRGTVHGHAGGSGDVDTDLRRIVEPDLVFEDLGREARVAEFLRDVIGSGFVFGRSGDVWGFCQGTQVFFGAFGIGDGEETRLQSAFSGCVTEAEDRGVGFGRVRAGGCRVAGVAEDRQQ